MAQFRLLTTRRFGPLMLTQFLGALADNLLRNAWVVLAATGVATLGLSTDVLVNVGAAAFIAPFFVLSATAGQLAERIEKSGLIRWLKGIEIGLMLLAALGFWTQQPVVLLTTLVLMGAQSALFGPVKFAILPQHLRDDELVGGNAMVEMGTFAAIVLGTIGGGLLVTAPGGPRIVAMVLVAIASIGYLSARRVPEAPPTNTSVVVDANPIRATRNVVGLARAHRPVFLGIVGVSWFWFLGAVIMAQLPGLADAVAIGPRGLTGLLVAFSVGIGIGSLCCERLSAGRVELGLVPLGSLLLSAAGLDLCWQTASDPTFYRIATDVAIMGVAGGLFIVPLFSMVQQRSPMRERCRILAANNVMNAVFVVGASGIGIALRAAGLGPGAVIGVIAVANIAASIYIYRVAPEYPLRLMIWAAVNTIYRFRTVGLQRIPSEGPVLLVCNHVSFVDALVIAAAVRRPVRFVMDYRIARTPGLRWFFRAAGVVPIAPRSEDPAVLERAMQRVAALLGDAEVVCIFPEGRLTQDGGIARFRPGIEKIVDRTPVTVVPLALRGLWGSFFSRSGGKAMRKWPSRFWSKIELHCGVALAPGEVTAADLQQRVARLRGSMA